jgi:isopenicillin N synthase-like dioxygenase
VKAQARRFFELPLEEKGRVRRTFENVYGYFESELTKNVRDWKELFDYGPKPRPDLPDGAPENRTLDGRNQWPEAPPGFRWACLGLSPSSFRAGRSCYSVLRRLSVKILRSFWVEVVAVPEA